MSRIDDLLVPVNPEYDFEGDPHEQADYANPVVLSNKLVQYGNAMIEVGKAVVALARRREKGRLEKAVLERTLVDMRRDVLTRNPAPPSAAKNLALTDAYVFKCLVADGTDGTWREIERQIAALDDTIEGIRSEEDNLKYMAHTVKLASENITNRLSFTKHEAQMSRFST